MGYEVSIRIICYELRWTFDNYYDAAKFEHYLLMHFSGEKGGYFEDLEIVLRKAKSEEGEVNEKTEHEE
jgi:hypothetical protein